MNGRGALKVKTTLGHFVAMNDAQKENEMPGGFSTEVRHNTPLETAVTTTRPPHYLPC